MNLVISGVIDESLINAVVGIASPLRLVRLSASAFRLEGVIMSPVSRADMARICSAARVDHTYVDHEARLTNFGLLVLDMDSTLITIECIDEIADFVGKKKEVSAITEAAMNGKITNFGESLRLRVALLAGTSDEVLRRVFEERVKLSNGAYDLIGAAKAANTYTLLVSGGFTYFTDRLAKMLKLDSHHANNLEIIDGTLTGRLVDPVLDQHQKAAIVRNAMSGLKVAAANTLVVGDGFNDIPMMNLVTNSVAYRAKAEVKSAARHVVEYGDLKTVVDYFS